MVWHFKANLYKDNTPSLKWTGGFSLWECFKYILHYRGAIKELLDFEPTLFVEIRLRKSICKSCYLNLAGTGKSLSEALILASTNPQYKDRLFIELQVQYVKIPSSEYGENMSCTEIVSDIQNNFCTQHVLPMFCKNKNFWQRFTCKNYKKNLLDMRLSIGFGPIKQVL